MFPNPAQPCVNDYFTLLLRRLKAPDANLNDISLQRKKQRFVFKTKTKISLSNKATLPAIRMANVSQRTRGITAVLSRPAA
jgi:hypothetical protein